MNKSAWRQEHIWPCCIRIICTTIGQFANSRQVNTLMERILNRVLKNQSESNQKDLTEQRKPSKGTSRYLLVRVVWYFLTNQRAQWSENQINTLRLSTLTGKTTLKFSTNLFLWSSSKGKRRKGRRPGATTNGWVLSRVLIWKKNRLYLI